MDKNYSIGINLDIEEGLAPEEITLDEATSSLLGKVKVIEGEPFLIDVRLEREKDKKFIRLNQHLEIIDWFAKRYAKTLTNYRSAVQTLLQNRDSLLADCLECEELEMSHFQVIAYTGEYEGMRMVETWVLSIGYFEIEKEINLSEITAEELARIICQNS